MDEKKMVETAMEYGFTRARVIPAGRLVFQPELRVYCEQNACGNYGCNYACPPDSGTPAQMKARTEKYSRALVLQTIQPVESVMNSAETKLAKKVHNTLSAQLMDCYEEAGVKGLRVMAGPCALCEKCARIEGKPCRFPDRVASCLSAYCIDAAAMAEACGMPYWCGNEEVPFFSIYFF